MPAHSGPFTPSRDWCKSFPLTLVNSLAQTSYDTVSDTAPPVQGADRVCRYFLAANGDPTGESLPNGVPANVGIILGSDDPQYSAIDFNHAIEEGHAVDIPNGKAAVSTGFGICITDNSAWVELQLMAENGDFSPVDPTPLLKTICASVQAS
jgi:hypothetical protein